MMIGVKVNFTRHVATPHCKEKKSETRHIHTHNNDKDDNDDDKLSCECARRRLVF